MLFSPQDKRRRISGVRDSCRAVPVGLLLCRMRAKAEGGLKYLYYGLGGLAALIVAIFAVILAVVFWPEKPSSVERLGAFEVYRYHYDSLGEPGHERMELWYHGRRL